LVCIGLAAAELYLDDGQWGFPLDDSWIHLVFARSLAGGGGLALNAGELVSGSTAPLWTALLSLGFLVPGGPVLWAKLLGVLLHLVAVWGVAKVAHRLDLAPWSTLVAAAFSGVAGWLVWSALSGLEIPLFLALSTWGMVFHVEERARAGSAPRSLALFAASALARPEGLLLLGLAVADRALTFRRGEGGRLAWGPPAAELGRSTALGLAAALVLVAPVALFNLWVGGSPLPSTYLAKTASVHSLIPTTAYLYSILGIFFRAFPLLVLLVGVGLLDLVTRWGTARDRGSLPAMWLLALPLAYGALSPPGGPPLAGNFGRYLFPAFPAFFVLGALGLERLSRAMSGPAPSEALGLRGGLAWRTGLLAVLVLWPAGTGTVRAAGRYLQSVGNVRDSDVRIAGWLAGRLPEEAVLAVNDIGAIKYRLREQRILDLAGIANQEVVTYRKEAIAAGRPPSEGNRRFLEENRPDYLVVFPAWFPELVEEGSGFPAAYRIAIPDNITMGDNSIVVLQTPWTRSPLDPTQGTAP
jgi:hypothetical protein